MEIILIFKFVFFVLVLWRGFLCIPQASHQDAFRLIGA